MTPFVRTPFAVASVALALFAVGCSSSADEAPASGAGGAAPARPADAKVTEELPADRDYQLHEPATKPSGPAPLLVMLHGYTEDPTPRESMEKEMHVLPEASKRGIYVVQPLGSYDKMLNKHYWNATDACCGWNQNYETNDIGFLHAVISDIEKKVAIDPKRIFVFGHSNGGFMSHRLACDTAGRFAGIVSLAGAPWKDAKKCKPSAPIAILQVHGDADTTIPYAGGEPLGILSLPQYPGAKDLIAMWAEKNACTAGSLADVPPPVDLVADIDGAETHKQAYAGCEANGATELWTIQGGPHSPNFNDAWAKEILDFLEAHPKP